MSIDMVTNDGRGPTFLGKLVIFLFFPTLMGMLGLYVAHLEASRDEEGSRRISFDYDFGLPFALTLALCVVIGFQTGGFTGRRNQAWIIWPKVTTRKKVVHSHVVRKSVQTTHGDPTEQSSLVEESKKDK
jgi:hypothetical protein